MGYQATRIPISKDTPLRLGDEVELRYKWRAESLTGRAAQWAVIESNLEKQYPRWQVLRYVNSLDYLVVTIRVIEPQEPEPEIQQAGLGTVVTAAIITAAIIGAGYYVTASLHEVYLISETVSETPEGRFMATGLGAAGWAALIGLAYLIFFRK